MLKCSNNSGYSFIEALIVLVILLFSSVVGYNIVSSTSMKDVLISERNEMMEVILDAQQKSVAVAEGNQYSVVFSPPGTYTLLPSNTVFILSNNVTIHQPAVSETVTFSKLTGKPDKELEIVLVSKGIKTSISIQESGIIAAGSVSKL